jgi:general stress protein 26
VTTVQHDEAIKKVADLLGKTNIATLATIRSERIVCRPMVVQPAEFDGDVWFFRYKDSNKIQEIDLNPEVNIAFES